MKIAIATDHNGVLEKEFIISKLDNVEFLDCSKSNNLGDDYPDFALKLCKNILEGNAELGVLMCGTGIGMSIAANKVKGIRCAHCSSIEEAHLAREHNNANIIAISYKYDKDLILNLVKEFITTKFSNEERHIRRVSKITKYENGEYNEF